MTERRRPCLSVAPMMGYTTPHWRQLARQLTQRTLLYTEMLPAEVVAKVSAVAVAARDTDPTERLRALVLGCGGSGDDGLGSGLQQAYRPLLAVQLGGNDPVRMGEAAGLIIGAVGEGVVGEVNINIGCPSTTVSLERGYGAALMARPEVVAVSQQWHLPPTSPCLYPVFSCRWQSSQYWPASHVEGGGAGPSRCRPPLCAPRGRGQWRHY
eukprot:COSAG01_NODE_7324_length_3256_cov_1.496510_2_plen_211_part_00